VNRERVIEEGTAFRRLAAGDRRVRDQLAARYLPLVRHLAHRYAHTAEPFDDLVQVGSIGLLKAIDRFDPDNGSAFSSFAVPTILGEIRRHFRDRTWSVHVPRPLKELAAVSRDAEATLERRLGRAPTAAEVAGELGTTIERLLEARLAAAAQHPDSLDQALRSEDDDPLMLQDRVGVDDPAIAEAEDAATLSALTRPLDERDRELVRLRFEEDLTQRDIGVRVGLSQMHVSRLLNDALRRIGDELGETAA
jgi:RNA polymerase sigma-B factor